MTYLREGVNMEDFFEKVKDVLYNSMDYIAMIVIVVAIAVIIGWRLDLLFADNHLDASNEQNIAEENNQVEDSSSKKEKDKPQEDENQDKDDKKDKSQDKSNDDNEEQDQDNAKDKDTDTDSLTKDMAIDIPDGSFPPQIGSILETEGIINDSEEFVSKAEDLQLETKLRSGSFEFPKGSTLNDIIKIIAGQK